MGQAASPEELEEAKRAALGLMRKAKTMVLATVKPDGTPYAAKVYYALDRGFVFLLEKGGTTLNNVLRTGRAAFTIDLDKPDLFIQGEGVVEVLGEPRGVPRRQEAADVGGRGRRDGPLCSSPRRR